MIGSFKAEREIHSCGFNSDGTLLIIGFKEGEIMLLKSSDNFLTIEKVDSTRQRKACAIDIK